MHSDLFGHEAASVRIKLARNVDLDHPCHENIAVLRPGRAGHAGEFRCATCDVHRGWASKVTVDFIHETFRRFGAPSELITVRQTQKEKTMAFERKNNSGSMFGNDRKAKETDPDRTGCALIDGAEYFLNGWLRKTKDGKPYLSLSFKRKSSAGRPAAHKDDFNDSVGF